MSITLADREIIADIVTRAVSALLPPELRPPALETKPEPQAEPGPVEPPQEITVGGVLEKARAYRAALRHYDRTSARFSGNTGPNADKSVSKARDELNRLEEDFKAFCVSVATGRITITRRDP